MAQVDIVVTTKGVENADPTKPSNGGGESAQSPIKALNTGTSGNNVVSLSIYANQLKSIGERTLKQTFNFAKNHYGDFTGDYIGQTRIDNAFNMAETAIEGFTTIGAGFASGGVIGAGVAAVVYASSLAIESAQNSAIRRLNLAKTNAQAGFNSTRLGVILTGGNR